LGKLKRKLLDKTTGENTLRLFEAVPEWFPTEAPLNTAAILGLARPRDTISVWIRGSCSNPQLAHSVENVIAGIDVLTHEPKPDMDKNEPSGNAYHYILQGISDSRFPYILYGPVPHGTIISHWFGFDDLDVYFKQNRK
jgi:hypothetical protein